VHNYAIFGHDRAKIGRWLGVVSIAISGGMSQLLVHVYALTGIEAFTKATITTAVIYFILHWVFNKYIWKLPFFEIPNLSGKWEIVGKTLEEGGGVKYNWNAEIKIEQNWKEIINTLKTNKSQSYSQTATIEKRHGFGGWLLSYSYKNEPLTEQYHELSSHKGYCQIEFDKDIVKGDASYFNNNGRRTFGIMKLVKVTDD